jgi:hypothetical protein
VEGYTGQAVRHLYFNLGLLSVVISSEDLPNTHDGAMLAPSYMVSLSIGCSKTRAIRVPSHADYLIIIVQAEYFLFSGLVFIFVLVIFFSSPLVCVFLLWSNACL